MFGASQLRPPSFFFLPSLFCLWITASLVCFSRSRHAAGMYAMLIYVRIHNAYTGRASNEIAPCGQPKKKPRPCLSLLFEHPCGTSGVLFFTFCWFRVRLKGLFFFRAAAAVNRREFSPRCAKVDSALDLVKQRKVKSTAAPRKGVDEKRREGQRNKKWVYRNG